MPDAALLLLKAALVGVLVSAPPGPVGALCIGRTLRCGVRAGLWSGFGAALGDTLYAAIVLAGVATLLDDAPGVRAGLGFAAAPLLVAAGVRVVLRVRRAAPAAVFDDSRVARSAGVCGAAVLTLGAPGTLPAFLALFAALALPGPGHPGPVGAALVCAGVLAGSMVWWAVVCNVVHTFRRRALARIALVDYATGALLVVAGVTALCAGLGAVPGST